VKHGARSIEMQSVHRKRPGMVVPGIGLPMQPISTAIRNSASRPATGFRDLRPAARTCPARELCLPLPCASSTELSRLKERIIAA
jgi:hypothetical protein